MFKLLLLMRVWCSGDYNLFLKDVIMNQSFKFKLSSKYYDRIFAYKTESNRFEK